MGTIIYFAQRRSAKPDSGTVPAIVGDARNNRSARQRWTGCALYIAGLVAAMRVGPTAIETLLLAISGCALRGRR